MNMNTQRLVLFAARLCGLAPYIGCEPSKAWRWYSIALLFLISADSVAGIVFTWFQSPTWYLMVSTPLIALLDGLIAVLLVRRQHPALRGLLVALDRELSGPAPVRWLGPLLVMTLLAVGIVASELAYYAQPEMVGHLVTDVLHITEMYVFAVLALGLISQYADVNDRIVLALLGSEGGGRDAVFCTAGGRHQLVIDLRRQHCRISKLRHDMWRCFHVQVTLFYMVCGELLVVRTAALLDTTVRHRHRSVWFSALSTLARVLSAIVGILVGDRITAEGNRTLDLVHDCLNIGNLSVAEAEELNVFAMYLYQRPVQIKMIGFIRVEHTLMIKAAGALLSYLLICLQFN